MMQGEKATLNLITDSMTIDLNVFGTFMKDGVSRNVHRRLVITEEFSTSRDCNTKISQQLL